MLRTPDEQFENLPDWPYEPHYVDVNGARVHYVDEGAGEIILCLHGQPTWAYLYRKMIPPLAEKYRVVAMDWVGFGRSDKYRKLDDYTYAMHQQTLHGFITALDLNNITLVCQDWGGLLGLPTAAVDMPERFARLVIMNTGLPTAEVPMPEAFLQWRAFVEKVGTKMQVGRVIQNGCVSELPAEVKAAYDAPFPSDDYKAGVAKFPLLVPTSPQDPASPIMRNGLRQLHKWDKPTLVMFSDEDPIMKGGDKFFRRWIPSAAQQPEIVIEGAGHFLQEEKGEILAEHIVAFMERT